ncbi:PAS domain S-box protein [Natrarchaeobius sp. A-rgal3]|uniref:PAS domain S-box protein n=1 Tax=Natrarchaeobius versutus TaxID=1679078 RepID=UPI00350FF987
MGGSGTGRSQRPFSVLFVDSDPSERSTIERELDGHAAIESVDAVATVDDARAAIADATGPEYDCIVTEYERAGDAARSPLLELERETLPVVVHTDGNERIAADAIAAGADGYAPKDCSNRLERLADQIVAATTNDGERDDLEAVHEVSLEFLSCTTVEETYRMAIDAAQRLLDAEFTALFVRAENPDLSSTERSLEVVSTSDPSDVWPAGRETHERLAGRVYRSDEAERIETVSFLEDRHVSENRSIVSVPIGSVGAVQAVSSATEPFTDADVAMLDHLGTHVGSTIERIRSQRALEAERDRFRSLFDTVPDAVVLVGFRSKRVLDVNPAFEETFGCDRSDLVDESIDDLLVPDDGEPIAIYDDAGVGTVVSAEVERIAADGRREFLFRGFAVEVGDDVHEYAIYTDITERKRRERDLERYRTLVETVGDPMYVLDTEGRIEMINDAMAASLGDDREAIVGSHATEYIPVEDVERAKTLLAELLADDDRQWDSFEMAVEPADDDRYLAEDNLSPLIDEDGSFAGSVGVIRDISERKERERRIRQLHDGTRRLMGAEGSEEVAKVATEVARDALDLRLTGVHLFDSDAGGLAPVATTDGLIELLGSVPTIEPGGGIAWDAYEAGEPIAHGDVQRDPNVRNPETPIRSEVHVPLGEYGVFIVSSTEPNDFDNEALTLAKILAANVEAALERAKRETELADRSRELERQNERLEQFAETVAHDLRNPLTLASGHLEAIDGVPAESTHVDEIEWALGRMDELIENVLRLARSGNRLVETEPIDLETVVRRARRSVDSELEVVLETPLLTVDADSDRLTVLFENVFRNAREHVGEDVTITVSATEGGFEIDDDGPGIPPEERDVVFESGYSTVPDGTGFGLAIVAEVVDAHGWTIDVDESELGGLRLVVSTDDR